MKDVFLKILTIVICSICVVGIVSAIVTDRFIIVHEGYLKSYTNDSLVFSDGYIFNGSYTNKTVLSTITFYELKQEVRDAYWEFRIYTDVYELIVS
jgi:hypothetical protein